MWKRDTNKDTVLQLTFASNTKWFSAGPRPCKYPLIVLPKVQLHKELFP
jgi:hypothetical protein